MVQTMKRALRKCLCDAGGENWDELLPYIAMGYRMSKQKSIGYSPYFLMFGRDACKFDMLRMSRLATDCKCDAYGIDIVAGIVHLEELFRGARLQE